MTSFLLLNPFLIRTNFDFRWDAFDFDLKENEFFPPF